MPHPKTITATLLAAALGLLPILPPEHAHDTEDHGGHHHLMMHRHADPHLLRGEHHEGATLDDTDPVVTLEPVFTAPAQVLLPTPILPDLFVIGSPLREPQTKLQELSRQPIHGPPREPSSPRAPPFQLSL